jgi:hypothetical protein
MNFWQAARIPSLDIWQPVPRLGSSEVFLSSWGWNVSILHLMSGAKVLAQFYSAFQGNLFLCWSLPLQKPNCLSYKYVLLLNAHLSGRCPTLKMISWKFFFCGWIPLLQNADTDVCFLWLHRTLAQPLYTMPCTRVSSYWICCSDCDVPFCSEVLLEQKAFVPCSQSQFLGGPVTKHSQLASKCGSPTPRSTKTALRITQAM